MSTFNTKNQGLFRICFERTNLINIIFLTLIHLERKVLETEKIYKLMYKKLTNPPLSRERYCYRNNDVYQMFF